MAARPKSNANTKTHDDYLANFPADQRAALEKLRKTIQAAAPQAEECISYQLAAFRLEGKPLVAYGATANHCAFYLMSSTVAAGFAGELKKYDTSKGTIRFQPDKPPPSTLVKKLVKARIAENEGSKRSQAPAAATGKRVTRPRVGSTKRRASRTAVSQTDRAVDAFLRALDHPLKQDIEAVRQTILGASPEIREAIKWNAPSFRTTEFFATVHLRSLDRVQLVFHKGTKVKDNTAKMQITDPAGLIMWLAADRCLVTPGAGKQIKTNQAALRTIVRQWIAQT